MKKYFQSSWTLKDLSIVFFSAILLLFASSALIGFTIRIIGSTVDLKAVENSSFFLLLTVLIQGLVTLTPVYFISKKKKLLKELGFEKIKALECLKISTTWYLAFLGIIMLVSVITIFTGIQIPGFQAQDNIIDIIVGEDLELYLNAFTVILLAPILEEIFFRGFLLRTLVNRINIFWGSTITAIVFSLIHLQPESLIPLLIISFILNHIVIKTKNIWPAISFHIINNAVAFWMTLNMDKITNHFDSIV